MMYNNKAQGLQGQPERTILFQHMKSKHKAGKRRKKFQLQLLPEKKLYALIKSRKQILTNRKVGKSECLFQCKY